MILEWFPRKEFYKLPVSAEKKSWRFPYFCKSYCQRKIGTFLWASLYKVNFKILWRHSLVNNQLQYTSWPIPQEIKAMRQWSFGQSIEYNMRKCFLEKSYTKCNVDTIPDPFLKYQNWGHFWINSLKFHAMQNRELSNCIETKLETTCFYLI